MRRRQATGGRQSQRRGAGTFVLCCALVVLAAAAADAVKATARVRTGKQQPVGARGEELRAKHAAVWPPRLTSAERADIMLPEALKTRALLEATHGVGRRLQVCICWRSVHVSLAVCTSMASMLPDAVHRHP